MWFQILKCEDLLLLFWFQTVELSTWPLRTCDGVFLSLFTDQIISYEKKEKLIKILLMPYLC